MAHNPRLGYQVDSGALELMTLADGRHSGHRGMKDNPTGLQPGSTIHWQAPDGMPPELGLIAALIWRAVCDALELGPNSKFGHSARTWIRSQSLEPGSYLWACDALQLEPERIRLHVKMAMRPDSRIKSYC